MFEIHLKVLSQPQLTAKQIVELAADSRADFTMVGDRGLQSPAINLVTNPAESYQTFPVITAYTEALWELTGIIQFLLSKDMIVEAYSGSFDNMRGSILFEPDAADGDASGDADAGWDSIIQGGGEKEVHSALEHVFSGEGRGMDGEQTILDQTYGTIVPIPVERRNGELVLPDGDRCMLGSKMHAKDAIGAFLARCGFSEYELITEDGTVSASASSNDTGVDIVSVAHDTVIPDTLQAYTFFQVYSSGTARREQDSHFAQGLGYFAKVSSGWEDHFLSGVGPLWVVGGPLERIPVTLRM